ncbi:MAG TPA: hypothetical protein VIY66_02995 [Candidatus Acidoferrales bacterium]
MRDTALTENVNPEPDARGPILRTGIYTGALLIIVMWVALVVANRTASLEPYALERNAAAYGLFLLFMLIPIARFWNRPFRMFASAVIAWVLFAATYEAAGMVFHNLFDSLQHSPLLVLMEGIFVYGLFAVGSWVMEMAIHARRHPIAPARKPAREAARHIR